MDENSINMIREDLMEDLHALTDVRTKAIGTLLEEFNDDLMMLMIKAEQALKDNASKEPTVDDERPMKPNRTTSRFYKAMTGQSLSRINWPKRAVTHDQRKTRPNPSKRRESCIF